MKTFTHIYTALKNLIVIAVFLGMLDVAASPFQTLVISTLALIYVNLINSTTIVVRTQIASGYTSANRFIMLAKMHQNKEQEVLDLEEDIEDDWNNFQKLNSVYYINLGFLYIMWVIAALSIVRTLVPSVDSLLW